MVSTEKMLSAEGGKARLLRMEDAEQNTAISAYISNAERTYQGLVGLLDSKEPLTDKEEERIKHLSGFYSLESDDTTQVDYLPTVKALNVSVDRKNAKEIDPVLKEKSRLAVVATEDKVGVLEEYIDDLTGDADVVLEQIVEGTVRPVEVKGTLESVQAELETNLAEAAEALKSDTVTAPELKALERKLLETMNKRNLLTGADLARDSKDILPEWRNVLAKIRVNNFTEGKKELLAKIDAAIEEAPIDQRKERAGVMIARSRAAHPSDVASLSNPEPTLVRPRAKEKPAAQEKPRKQTWGDWWNSLFE
jgi:hypothetical protein